MKTTGFGGIMKGIVDRHGKSLPGQFEMRNAQNQKLKGDLTTEIHFIGQIVGATDFNTEEDIFCECSVEVDKHWKLLCPKLQIQTQASTAEFGEMVVWAHPFDMHFATSSLYGWPRFVIRVWRVDCYGKLDIIAYGVSFLPNMEGAFDLECQTWSPMGGIQEEAYTFFLDGPPKLNQADPVSSDLKQRGFISSKTSGVVHIHCEVLLKNFTELGISGQKKQSILKHH